MLKAKTRAGRWYSRKRAFARARKQILSRDGFRCRAFVTCPNKKVVVHHIFPERFVRRWCRGGNPHIPENLLTVCRQCHGKLTAAEAPVFAGNFLEFERLNEAVGIPRCVLSSALAALYASCKK